MGTRAAIIAVTLATVFIATRDRAWFQHPTADARARIVHLHHEVARLQQDRRRAQYMRENARLRIRSADDAQALGAARRDLDRAQRRLRVYSAELAKREREIATIERDLRRNMERRSH